MDKIRNMDLNNPQLQDLRDTKAAELKKTIRAEALRMSLGFHSNENSDTCVDGLLNSAKKMFDFMEYGSVPPIPKKKK